MNTNSDDRKAMYRSDPLVNRILNRMPAHIVDSFTEIQLESLRQALAQPKRHLIDIRLSIPTLFQRFYIVFLAGPERRSLERLRQEKRKFFTLGNLLFLAGSVAVLGVVSYNVFLLFSGNFAQKTAAPEISNSYPTALPWIKTEAACKGQNRHWEDGLCYDREHNRDFRRGR